VLAGLLSEDILSTVPDRAAFMAALNEIAPLYGKDGKMIRVETHADAFNRLADDFVEKTYGADRSPLQKQQFPVDDKAMEALHQALAANPEGVAAFKPVGELTAQDQTALRGAFAREYAKSDPAAERLRAAVETLDKQEPAKESEGLFGKETNPDWIGWKQERDAAAEKANAAIMTWGKYIGTMGSPRAAYAAMSDVVRSKVLKTFADHHNTLRSEAPLKVGKQVIANDLKHLDALDPKARAARAERQTALMDSLRNRVAGRYASGSVQDKLEAARAAEEATAQAQMGLFGSPAEETPESKPPELGERYSLGHAAERQIAGMMDVVGPNFRPGAPIKTIKPVMSGKYVARQRAVKLIDQNKRMMLGMGVGSGKTSIMLSSFTDLKSKGKANKGLFLVPSVVQGQFHGEALKMLKPGAFRWHADPSSDRAGRIKAYKDPQNDFTVVTHQGFREDFDHVAMQRDGMTAEKFDAMGVDERKAYARDLMQKEGWNTDFLAVDEGHNLLNRAGKENSHLANVVDSLSSSHEYYVNASADPIKNDPSEAFDMLSKMEPNRYTDRDAFMRKYNVDTPGAKDALKREMARHFYTASIDPGVKANKRTVMVDVGPGSGQTDSLKAIDDAAGAARLARMQGKTDVAALKTLAPYAFEGVPEAQQEDVAKRLQAGLGMIHQTAVQHAVSDGAKTESLVKIANERKGKPGVVFAHRLDRVDEISKRLTAEGHRVVTLSGADSSAEKDRKKKDYQAGKYDVLVASDAGAVGANLQAGKWLVQYDTPQTAMLHAQRNGRIHRMGQDQDVELIDLVANHPSEQRARDRLEKKYGLREVMTSPLEGLDEHGLAGYLNQARAGTLEKERSLFMPAGEDEPKPPEPPPGTQLDLAA
jgi:Helicase conserved C-terminal domain/Type III restriction enzyme, res subunit